MTNDDIKALRRGRRNAAMQDAAARSMWSGGVRRIPDKRKAADKRACRDWKRGGSW